MRSEIFRNMLGLASLAIVFSACTPEAETHGCSAPSAKASGGYSNARCGGVSDDWNDNAEPLPVVLGTEMPAMDSRVAAYQMVEGMAGWNGSFGNKGIVDSMDILESWFSDKLNNEKCNYFAILNSTNSTASGHLVLAQDMVLRSLLPSAGEPCAQNEDVVLEAMLVCDDAENSFKSNINLNGSYAVPGWDCGMWQGAEKRYF